MRFNIRLAGAIALILIGATSCSSATDGLTGTREGAGTKGRLAISPTFSPAAAQALNALVANGADITKIHIVLTDLGGKVILDTLVAFPAGQDSIAVQLPIDIQGQEEQFNAQIDLTDATGVVQFAIKQMVTARSANLPALTQTPVVLQYVGPGASAKAVAVSPSDANMGPGATQSILATALDSAGNPLGNLAVVWTSSDSTIVRVTATGPGAAVVTARGPRGTVTITAKTLTGIAGTAKINVLPQAGGLTVIAGPGQTGAALDTLPTPFTVELRGTDGAIMAGVLVSFSAITSGGEVVTVAATTDGTGRATSKMKLGRTVGAYTYQAASGTVTPVTVSANATAAPIGPPTQLVPLTGLPASFTVGVISNQKFSAQLADAKGYYVLKSGVALNATMKVNTDPAKSVTALSDSQGIITLTVPAFDKPGSVFITLNVPDLGLTFSGTFTIK